MIQLSSDGASIIFDFINSQHYLYGTGTITVPLNTLTLVLDESDMVTFKKSEGDIFVSAPIEEFEGFDKESIASWFASNGVGTPVAEGIDFRVVDSLPVVGSPKYIYLLSTPDGWEEWIWVEGEWVAMGVMSTSFYNGKDAIQIAKSATTASAYTVSLKIDPASNSAITQSNNGLKFTAENNIKAASSSTRPTENKEIYKRFSEIEIKSGETVSSTTYQLYSLDEPKDVKIEVVNDKYTSAITVDNDNQQILLDVVQPDKTVKVLSGNMEEVIFESDLSDGLTAVSHSAKVKIDDASNSGLTVSASGVKLTAENNVKTASSSTRPVQTDEVFRRFDALEIKSGQTASSTTYSLWSLDEEKPLKVEVPNDEHISAVSIDNNSQQVLLDLKKADGSVQVLSGNMENVIFESDLSDGLTAVSHSAKVKIDPASNSGLTVNAAGVKLDAESNIKTASASTKPVQTDEVFRRFDTLEIESARTSTGDTYQLKSLDELKDNLVEVKDTFHIVSALPASGDVEILYILETTNAETSAKTYTQYIWKDGEWKQTSALGNVYSGGTNIDIYKAQPTDDFYTISGANFQSLTAVPTSGTSEERTIYAVRKGTSGDYYYELYGKIDDVIYPLGDDLSDYVLDSGEY